MLKCAYTGCTEQAGRGGYCERHQKYHLKRLAAKIEQRMATEGNKVAKVSTLMPDVIPRKTETLPFSSLPPPKSPPAEPPSEVKIQKEEQQEKKDPTNERCTLEFCGRRLKSTNANGLCAWHRYHQLIGLKLEPAPEPIPFRYECDWPECHKRQSSCGFCSQHVTWLRKTEKESADEEALSSAIQKRISRTFSTHQSCKISGCEFPALDKGIAPDLCGKCMSMYRIWRDQYVQAKTPALKFSESHSRVFEEIYLREQSA